MRRRGCSVKLGNWQAYPFRNLRSLLVAFTSRSFVHVLYEKETDRTEWKRVLRSIVRTSLNYHYQPPTIHPLLLHQTTSTSPCKCRICSQKIRQADSEWTVNTYKTKGTMMMRTWNKSKQPLEYYRKNVLGKKYDDHIILLSLLLLLLLLLLYIAILILLLLMPHIYYSHYHN